jgi:hypothetical protein
LPLAVLATVSASNLFCGEDALDLGGVDHLAVVFHKEMVLEIDQLSFQRFDSISLRPDLEVGFGFDANEIFESAFIGSYLAVLLGPTFEENY